MANAGDDQILMLPIDIVKLDGSKSSDDKGIVKYSWTRDPTSLAAGVCITCGKSFNRNIKKKKGTKAILIDILKQNNKFIALYLLRKSLVWNLS